MFSSYISHISSSGLFVRYEPYQLGETIANGNRENAFVLRRFAKNQVEAEVRVEGETKSSCLGCEDTRGESLSECANEIKD